MVADSDQSEADAALGVERSSEQLASYCCGCGDARMIEDTEAIPADDFER